LVNVNSSQVKATVFVDLLFLEAIGLGWSVLLLEDARHKSLEAVPLLVVPIHVLLSLQQDQSAFITGARRGKSKRDLELVDDALAFSEGIRLNWVSVLFELDSELEELDGDISLDLGVKGLVPSIVDLSRELIDFLWDDASELFRQLVLGDHVLHVDTDLMEHEQLFLAQGLFRSVELTKLFDELGQKWDRTSAWALHNHQ
jgi:hypothetical protein